MINILDIFKEASTLGSTKTLTELKEKFNTYNYEQLVNDKVTSNYKVEIWDKVTLINGIQPNIILNQIPNYTPDAVYLIYINGGLVYLQTHEPYVAGHVPMTEEKALEIANDIVRERAESEVDKKLNDELLEFMLT